MLQLQAVVALDSSRFTSGLSGMSAVAANATASIAASMGGATTSIAAMFSAFGPIGAVVAGLTEATKVGASFEQSLANVASVSGLTGDALEQIGEAARNAARQTKFTAGEAADALYSLASAGISTADELTSTLTPALLLAGATGSATSLATETLTAALANYRLEAKDATKVADMFAGAIASSPENMERLSEAFKYAGPAGAAFGMSLTDVNKEVAAFHQVGLRGEQAGTAFRMALLEGAQAAQSGSGLVGAALAGWSASQEGLTGAVRRFEEAGVDGAAVIQELGARSGPGLAALLALGSEAIENLGDKIQSVSNVQAMYDTQMNTTTGKFAILRSGIEEIGIKIFEHLVPAFEKIIGTAQRWLDSLDSLLAKHGQLVGNIASVLPLLIGAGGIAWAFNKIAAIIHGLGGSMSGLFAIIFTSMQPTAAALEVMATRTLPMVASANVGLATAMKAGTDGFFKYSDALTLSANKSDVFSGMVAKSTITVEQANALTTKFAGNMSALGVSVSIAAAAFAGWKIGEWIGEMQVGDATIRQHIQSIIEWTTGVAAASNELNAYNAVLIAEQKARADAVAATNSQIAAQKKQAEELAQQISRQIVMEALRASAIEQTEMKQRLLDNVTSSYRGTLLTLEPVVGASIKDSGALANAKDVLETKFKEVTAAAEKFGWAAIETQQAVSALYDAERKIEQQSDVLASNLGAVRVLVSAMNLSFEDARAAVDKFGVGAVAVAERATRMGITFREAADDAAWMKDNAEIAADILANDLALGATGARDALDQFGMRALEVARAAKEQGLSLADAAEKLGVYAVVTKAAKQDTEPLVEQFGKMSDKLVPLQKALHSISDKAMGEFLSRIKTLAKELAGIPAPDLKWLRDLGTFDMPHISETSGKNAGRSLKAFIEEIGKAMNGANKPDLKWLNDLSGFKAPSFVGLSHAADKLKDFADKARGIKPPDLSWLNNITALSKMDLSSLKEVLNVLKDIPSGNYKAEVLLKWDDNSTLASIDSSLQKLAGMKGVIWD